MNYVLISAILFVLLCVSLLALTWAIANVVRLNRDIEGRAMRLYQEWAAVHLRNHVGRHYDHVVVDDLVTGFQGDLDDTVKLKVEDGTDAKTT